MNCNGAMSVPPRNGWDTGDLTAELRPGKSATRWLHDFLKGHVGDYVDENGEPFGSLFVPCRKSSLPHFLTLQGLDEGNGQHDLLIIESQSIEDQQLSCICRFCKYHFLFRFDKKCDLCPPKKLHHLVRLAVDRAVPQLDVPEESDRNKYFPQTNSALWQCSEKQCGFKVMVYMTRPRLQVEQVELVADVGRIERQAAAAKQEDPERFKDLHENITKTALVTLNAYLRDITKKPEDTQTIKIAARNKRFMVQFGESCSDFFNYLGFSKVEYEGDRYWLLPNLKHYPGDKTPIGSQRAFFEDVRSEVQALLDGSDLNAHTKEVVPVPALHRLWKALDSTPLSASGVMPEDNTAYVKLGILPNSDDQAVQQAYEAQIEADPARSADYLQALSEIAASRGSDLQFFAAQQQSLVDNQHRQMPNDAPLAVAYHHFGLDSNQAYPDDQIIQIYNVLCESSPAQNSEHRHNLAVIGRSKKSTAMMRAACASLSFEAACQILGLDGVTKDATVPPDAGLIETYANIVEKEGKDCFLIAAALDTIADAFEPIREQLRAAANTYRRGERAVEFPELMGEEPVDLNVPLGIENLRNTCYLNSILQYFYTITPVRDLVLERTSGSIQQQVIEFPARMTVEQAEIYIGQELIKSLGDLFTQLKYSKGKSVLPPQRLANAASISLEKIRKTPASTSGSSPSNTTTSMEAPPLPTRPGVTGPSTDVPSGHTMSVVTVSTVEDVSGTSTPASMASSQTLIDHPMEDPPQVQVTQADADSSASARAAAGLEEAHIDTTSEGLVKDTVGVETAANAGASATVKTDATSPIIEHVSKQDIDAILDQTEIHGTDQMDVEEIMGRCLGYIRAAINTNSIRDQTSSDIIFDTFYTHYVDVKKPKDQSRIIRTQVVDRWFTAYPGVDGRVNLYDALAGTFDLEEVSATEGSLDRFTSIVKPAPIFHIFIQRSAIGIKNANPVEIPDELYLDRYMDAPEDSQLFQIRKRGWNLKRQIEEYQTVLATSKSLALEATLGSLHGGGGDVELYEESNLGIDSADDGSFVVVDGDSESLIQLASDDNDAVMVGDESSDEEMEDVVVGTGISHPGVPLHPPALEELKAELAGLFDGLTTYKYRLHAVICHAGQMAAGHYWVWIFDFDAGVWRKYNDAAVMERPTAKTHEVLEELSTRGEPYYLAYVREEGRDELVQVPPRHADEVIPPAPALVPEYDDLLLAYEG